MAAMVQLQLPGRLRVLHVCSTGGADAWVVCSCVVLFVSSFHVGWGVCVAFMSIVMS